MFKRKRISKHTSKKYFSRTAGSNHVHPKNMMGSIAAGPLRGGIRL